MKVFHFDKQEFQLLKSIEPDKVEFQKKIFVRDVDVSLRTYPRLVKSLQEQDNDATACLMVEMEGYYTIWHEVTTTPSSSPLEIPDEKVLAAPSFKLGVSRDVATQPLSAASISPVPPFLQPVATQTAQANSTPNVSDSQKITALIAKVVQDVVEAALAQNTHIVPEHLVEALKTEIDALNSEIPITLEALIEALKTELPNPKVAQQLAQSVLSDETDAQTRRSMPRSLENHPEPSTSESSSKKRRHYRGVAYEVNSEPLPEDKSGKKKRQYRGKSY